jgi:hypothetical protein
MQRQAVDSESIATIAYDETSAVLEIEFADGSNYRYFDVPADVHRQFKAADSKGRFFHRMIRRKYFYERI